MSQGFQQLVSVLESRYDFQSARTMAREALQTAGLKEQDKYSKDELQQFVDGLSRIGAHLDGVYSALGVAPTGAPAPAAEAPPAKEEAKAAPKEEAKADAKDDKKDDKKSDAKDDKKSDAKDDKKSDAKDDKKSDAKDDKKSDAKDDGGDDDKKGKKK